MKLFLAGAALIALTAPAIAQDAPPPPPPPGAPMHHLGGRDGPGHWAPPSRDQIIAMATTRFQEMDANHDGTVTKAEFDTAIAKRRALFEARMKEHRDRKFDALDTNKDGKISRAEFDAPPKDHMRGPDGPPPGGPDGPPPPPPGDHPGKGPMGRHHGMGPMPAMAGGMGMPMSERWFERADSDHDGKVTLAEAQAAAGKMYDRFLAHREGDEPRGDRRDMRRDGGGRTGPGYDLPAMPPAPPALPRT